jgi:hypothetical protein
MFCPKCGQQQAAEGLRFCPRCGFALGGVVGLLEAGGYAPVEGGSRALTKRQRGVRKGLIVTTGGLCGVGVAALLTAMNDDFFIFMPVAALVFIIGLMRMLYGMLLEEDEPARGRRVAATAGAKALPSPRTAHLPPARSVPAGEFTRGRAETAEMAAPPSVAEGTTRIMKEDD